MVYQLANFGYFMVSTLGTLRYAWQDRQRVWQQMEQVGVATVGLALLVGFFAGSIIAWQAAYQFTGLASLSILGGQATRVILMEIGPVLTALILAGRIGASMAAEIGTMVVTEQIDALRTLSLNPVRYVVMPRLLALFFMTPCLTIFANLVGIVGAFVVTNLFMELSYETFLSSVKMFFQPFDLWGGLIKAAVFGVLIALIGCYCGLQTEGGATGVGKATVRAFVTCALMILVSDYFLWLILF